jgi:hypothetical protein
MMGARNVNPTAATTQEGATGAPRGPRRRGRVARAIAVAIVAFGLATFLVLLAVPGHGGPTRAAARTRHLAAAVKVRAPRHIGRTRSASVHPSVLSAQVSIAPGAAVMKVPRSFFGLSTEYWSLPLYERQIALFERVLSLVRVRGNGPLVLRIGGDSADHSFWDPRLRIVPPWVFPLTPEWLRGTSAIVRTVGVRLMLDLNLVTDSAPVAAGWVRAAERGLPRRSIVGFEVGNEPDIYSHWYWRSITSRTKIVTSELPTGISARSYARDFRSYSRMLARVAPHVPVAGPALANPFLDVTWISRLLRSAHQGLRVVSAHRYPYSACVDRRSPGFPTIARVLSENASAGTARAVTPAVRLAHRAGLPFRLTELNSVTCGGLHGVSDTFATALWAPDTLFELLRAHVDGVNVHIRATSINAPFILGRNGLDARPLLYGLILFARTLGPDPALVRLKLHAPPAEHLKAWAVTVRGGVLHVLLINKGNRPVRVQLRIPASGPATVQRLDAPSVAARFGEQLGGRQLGTDGLWRGAPGNVTVRPGGGAYELAVPQTSAALMSVRLAPGALVPQT